MVSWYSVLFIEASLIGCIAVVPLSLASGKASPLFPLFLLADWLTNQSQKEEQRKTRLQLLD